MDFWEYSHNFDSEDGAFSIDEDITFEASQQELQIELEHFNEMDLEQELPLLKKAKLGKALILNGIRAFLFV